MYQATPPHWPAPVATGPVGATVRIPGSKSMTNRALVLAALADGPGTIAAPLRSRDSDLMVAALRALGADLRDDDAGWRMIPRLTGTDARRPTRQPPPTTLKGETRVDCGLAGTVMRFVPPMAALTPGTTLFDGDPQARTRPMGPVLQALRGLGAEVTGDALPFTVRGPARGGSVTLDASASSQLVSGLLLAGARYPSGVTVRHEGPPVPSAPHIRMTVAMLRDSGVTVDDTRPGVWRVEPGPIKAREFVIEPDLSNAAPFLAAALVTGGSVTIPDWPRSTAQPGGRLPDLLTEMGGSAERRPYGMRVDGTGRLRGIDANLGEVGELTPAIAALAALADGPSTLRGVAHLRGHETDRLAALASEINRLGGDARETGDGLEIRSRPLRGGLWRSYHDHRMATAGAIIGLAVPGVEVENIATTGKTLPGFPDMWGRMLEAES